MDGQLGGGEVAEPTAFTPMRGLTERSCLGLAGTSARAGAPPGGDFQANTPGHPQFTPIHGHPVERLVPGIGGARTGGAWATGDVGGACALSSYRRGCSPIPRRRRRRPGEPAWTRRAGRRARVCSWPQRQPTPVHSSRGSPRRGQRKIASGSGTRREDPPGGQKGLQSLKGEAGAPRGTTEAGAIPRLLSRGHRTPARMGTGRASPR